MAISIIILCLFLQYPQMRNYALSQKDNYIVFTCPYLEKNCFDYRTQPCRLKFQSVGSKFLPPSLLKALFSFLHFCDILLYFFQKYLLLRQPFRNSKEKWQKMYFLQSLLFFPFWMRNIISGCGFWCDFYSDFPSRYKFCWLLFILWCGVMIILLTVKKSEW